MASVEDSWVVVDKTASGTLRAKASHESLYGGSSSDEEDTGLAVGARVHIRDNEALAPELLSWLNNSANDSSAGLPLAERNASTSKNSFRTNSSSAHRTSVRSSNSHNHRCSTSSVDEATSGTFVVKVVEVRQVGAGRPMNLQCAAAVGSSRYVIPHVMTRPKDYNTWSAKMDDTFVFDVSRPFTFNLGVYASAVETPAQRAPGLPHRLSMAARRHVGRNSMASDSAPALSTKPTGKLRAGFRRIFGARPETDAAYAGFMAGGGDAALGVDPVTTAETTDAEGRRIQVQQHVTQPLESMADLREALPAGPLRAPRLSTLLPRSRTSTVASAAAAFAGRGRAASSASVASTGSMAPCAQPVGELFLDLRVERRSKRRATFILPAVNQEQVQMRGGAHVEMAVVLEFGVIVHETPAERARREQAREAEVQAQQRAEAEHQWDAADAADAQCRQRSSLSVFTRSGRLSTWRRYCAELSASHIMFFESQDSVDPVASVPLLHLLGAGVPSSDLVSIGPGGIELRLAPQAMTDRHRRTSAYPREKQGHDMLDDWQCRVYLLLDSLADRDRWLRDLTTVAVPSAERARHRMQLRLEAARMDEDKDRMCVAQTAVAKKVYVDGGHRVVSMSAAPPHDIDATLTNSEYRPPVPANHVFSDDTLTEYPITKKPAVVAVGKKFFADDTPPPVAMAFGKPATFSITVAPDMSSSALHEPLPPAKKRLRARRRSNSVADIYSKPSTCDLQRKGSGASTVLKVVGKAMERRPGTVSRRFLFVWNINEF
ncbi:hypothetical protein GGI20_004589 [Coemansia sp. BCRC 34301]|nr:hypothetical protein GGI20_004589 [Coemansia sp. BCRC 34301]